jgi:ABC-type antimicrobial peptide transport system permease subunit
VVGVVEDTKNNLVTDEPQPMLYIPLTQQYDDNFEVVVRSGLPASAVATELRRVLLEVAPSISLVPVIEMTTLTRMGVLPQRIAAGLSSLMGLLALILSGMGIYGVIAHAVSRRTREIGIRMALGAEKTSVLRLVVLGGLRLAAPGLVVGVLLALGLGKVLQTFLLGLSPADPATLVAVAVTLLGMVVVATIVPARRAAGVQPAEALRYE